MAGRRRHDGAPLVGAFRAYEVEGGRFRSFTLTDAENVYVSRRDLVMPADQVDELTG